MKNEWHPISTAPKDGTWILAGYLKDGAIRPLSVSWRSFHPNAKGKEQFRDQNGHKINRLSHWMPIPEPPKS